MADAQLEAIDQEIDLLETLKDLDAELKDFSTWIDNLTKGPKTGDVAVDYEIDQLRNLLTTLSDQLGHYTAPLREASDLAGRISGLVTAVDAISTAASNPDAPPDELVTALGDFIGGLNAALPLFGEVFGGLNPVIGAYLIVVGEMLKGIAQSVKVVADRVAVRNRAIDFVDQVIEGRYDLPGQEAVDDDEAERTRRRMEERLTELYLDRARREAAIRETDYRAALQSCLRRRNWTESDYEREVAELRIYEEEWGTLTTAGSFRPLTEAQQERLERVTELIDGYRRRIREVQDCVRQLLQRAEGWRAAPAILGGGCLWALIPFLLVGLIGSGAVLLLRDDGATGVVAGSGTEEPATSSSSSTSSSTSSTPPRTLTRDALIDAFGPMAAIFLDAGLDPETAAAVLDRFFADDDGGVPRFIYSIEGEDVTDNGTPAVDVQASYFGQLHTDLLPGLADSAFPCGPNHRLVVCGKDPRPFPAGPVFMAAMRTDGPVPTDDLEYFFIYSAVFDTGGDPATKWRAQDPFNWDYFQGTNRWYDAQTSPGPAQWFLRVRNVSADQQPVDADSDARAVIEGDAVVFFIPGDEVGGESACGRLAAFRHMGRFSPDYSAGDISGGAPTEALYNVAGERC